VRRREKGKVILVGRRNRAEMDAVMVLEVAHPTRFVNTFLNFFAVLFGLGLKEVLVSAGGRRRHALYESRRLTERSNTRDLEMEYKGLRLVAKLRRLRLPTLLY